MNPADFWFPWYPALYAEHAVALNLEQDAIYRRMIDRYMLKREPLLSNGQAVANICMISLEKWQEHSAIILPFFEEKEGLLHHKKCDIELDRQDLLSKKMSINGKKSAEKRNKNKPKQRFVNGGSTVAAIQDRTGQEKTGEKALPLPESHITKTSLTEKKVFKKSGFGGQEGVRGFEPNEKTQGEIFSNCRGWNLQSLLSHYENYRRDHGEPNYPQAAFVAWAKRFTRGRPPA